MKNTNISPLAPLDRFGVQGHVSPGFEGVRESFAENFVRRRKLGGACCAYYRGEKVVDLWGVLETSRLAIPGSKTPW
jgi:hypothetical protein